MSMEHQSWRYFGFNQAHDPVLEATGGECSWDNCMGEDVNLILDALEVDTLIELRVSGLDDYMWCTGRINKSISKRDLKISIQLDDTQDNGKYAGQHHVIDSNHLSARLSISTIRFVVPQDVEECEETLILDIHPAQFSQFECTA